MVEPTGSVVSQKGQDGDRPAPPVPQVPKRCPTGGSLLRERVVQVILLEDEDLLPVMAAPRLHDREARRMPMLRNRTGPVTGGIQLLKAAADRSPIR